MQVSVLPDFSYSKLVAILKISVSCRMMSEVSSCIVCVDANAPLGEATPPFTGGHAPEQLNEQAVAFIAFSSLQCVARAASTSCHLKHGSTPQAS